MLFGQIISPCHHMLLIMYCTLLLYFVVLVLITLNIKIGNTIVDFKPTLLDIV